MYRPTLLLLCLTALLMGCGPARPTPVLKVGLLGPFEGEYRALGYRLLPAIRAATPEQVRGQPVEWVILDTHGDPAQAAQRARELLVDPDLYAIVGPLLPEEVDAVAPLIQRAEVAWWPLAPRGEAGLRAWQGALGEGLSPAQQWGARAWPALRRGTLTEYLDPQLPADLGGFAPLAGDRPWPAEWLAWQAARHAFEALARAPVLERAAVRAAAPPLVIPPPARYRSATGDFPGHPLPAPADP